MALSVQVMNVVGARALRFDGARVRIGRGPNCEVRLPDGSISTHHATLSRRGHQWLIADEGSTNGTFVGAVRLAPAAPRVLAAKELVRVGRLWLEVATHDSDDLEMSSAETTRELALALVATRARAEDDSAPVRIRICAGPGAGRELLLDEGATAIIGRAPDAALVLTDPDTSRQHVEVRRSAAGVEVRDLGSKNGATLGGHELSGRFRRWQEGALLVLADTELCCIDPIAEALAAATLAADEPLDADDLIEGPLPATPPPVVPARSATAVERAPVQSGSEPTPAHGGLATGIAAPPADATQRRAATPAPPLLSDAITAGQPRSDAPLVADAATANPPHVDSEPLPPALERSEPAPPVKRRSPQPASARADLAVAAFAVLLIAVSALGLWWLTRLP